MRNPYKIEGPAAISFSGGRSSGFMLYHILQAHGGQLPDDIIVHFANTGREAPETLDFIRDCSEHWDVPITWLELDLDETNKIVTKIVDHETASRNGEPFTKLLNSKRILPGVFTWFCTSELKVLRMEWHGKHVFGTSEYDAVLGIRGDEKLRVSKIRGQNSEAVMPMADAGHTIQDILTFWKKHNFDLNLLSREGNTLWGNCDYCFLKGKSKLLRLINEERNQVRQKQKEEGIIPSVTLEDLPQLSWWVGREEVLKDDELVKKPKEEIPRTNRRRIS